MDNGQGKDDSDGYAEMMTALGAGLWLPGGVACVCLCVFMSECGMVNEMCDAWYR